MSRLADAMRRLEGAQQPPDEAREDANGAAGPDAGGQVTLPARARLATARLPRRQRDLLKSEAHDLKWRPDLAGKLVVSGDMPSIALEQYRRLAASLHQSQIERGTKLVMVTSAMPGEGKTLTSTNLALTLSESYWRQVLLIDADLRRPQVHDIFQLPNIPGFGDGLKSATERKMTAIQLTSRLAVLPAGRPDPDPMSGLASDRMRRLLKEAAASFDWVIVDTPPVGLLTDANLLTAMVDGVIFVIASGVTPYQVIHRAVQAIDRERILGVVLNRADDVVRLPQYAYYGYGYYGGDRD